jgi:hypothetical protein
VRYERSTAYYQHIEIASFRLTGPHPAPGRRHGRVRQGRVPSASPREPAFHRLVEEHYERFEQVYPERYEDRYGFFRTVIRATVYKYLGCAATGNNPAHPAR